jgi:hypothetical protein
MISLRKAGVPAPHLNTAHRFLLLLKYSSPKCQWNIADQLNTIDCCCSAVRQRLSAKPAAELSDVRVLCVHCSLSHTTSAPPGLMSHIYLSGAIAIQSSKLPKICSASKGP